MQHSDPLQEEQFFLTPKHVCSYLNRGDAQTLFYDPRKIITSETYSRLTKNGFRRSGSHLYRPRCLECNACTPTRLKVNDYNLRKSDKKTIKKNKDTEVILEDAHFNKRYYHLYERYIRLKHADGDMYPPSEDQYKTFLLSNWAESFFLSTYLDKKLISVAVTDKQSDCLSAVYTFYDPAENKRSLGTFNILNQIFLCQQLGLEYLYLGYWIKANQKMNYKINFKPTELLLDSEWVTHT